jgi:Tfp pilus assembly protein PilN
MTLVITGFVNARRDRQAISEKRALIAQRDQLRTQAQQFLNRPENRTTRDDSQFLNQLIERKAFSWTKVLESLERVMPPRVHVVSISPELNEDNQLALKMVVAGDSRDRAIELARRMEESRRFAQTAILRAAHADSQTGDTEQVEIVATYVPELLGDNLRTTAPAPGNTPAKPTRKGKTSAAKGLQH